MKSRARKDHRSTRPRRGATLVLVAIMMTVLMGFAALAIDFSRMYTFKSQVKTLTDAAALSGVYEKKIGRTLSDARTQAEALIANNKVDGAHVSVMGDTDIVSGTWDYATRTFTPSDWSNVNTNAVRAIARYTASWTLAKIFGTSTRLLQETSIGAIGSIKTADCLKPFAVPYASLLQRAGYTSPYDLTHVLTAADIAAMGGSSGEISFLEKDTPDGNIPGNFGFVDVNVTDIGNKNQEIADAMTGCVSDGLGIGSTLPGVTGIRNANVIKDAYQTLCGGNGNSGTCDVNARPILVPIYDTGTGTGNNATYHVIYIGAFKLTRYDKDGLYGYLTTMVATPGEGFSPSKGPVLASALVY